MSEVFHVDIHPAAQLGRGVMIDHATGVVIGETAVVGDNVSMLHHVTLGGSGTGRGSRHPTVGNGVLLGAGVTVLGPVTVGAGTKVGAGSVVVTDLPCHCVAVGVPARIIKRDMIKEPVADMDQCTDLILDYVVRRAGSGGRLRLFAAWRSSSGLSRSALLGMDTDPLSSRLHAQI
jgi:serine O-acetyltransferase